MELVFESKKQLIEIKEYEQLSSKIGNWTISDKYVPNTDKNLGEYWIIIKSKISKGEDELIEKFSEGEKIAERIGILITYAIGHPIDYETKCHYGLRYRIALLGDSIKGWSNNFKAIKKQIDADKNTPNITVTISEMMRNWVIIEQSPLNELLIMLSKYPKIDSITKLLILFHNDSLKHEGDLRHLLIGKSLEIVDVLLPKGNNKKRFGLLPDKLKNVFGTRDLSWLFMMSNFRMETRHVINKKSDTFIHNQMTDEEYYDFLYISENLITYLVRKNFDLELKIMVIKG